MPGAYRVTASLAKLDEPTVRLASTPEEAADIAWDFCQQYNLNIPNDNWKLKEWESFAGAYEESSTYDAMVRGLGNYPPRQDFCHYVTDKLSKRFADPMAIARKAMLFSAADMSMTPEPAKDEAKFETYRGDGKTDKITIVFDDSAKQSVVDLIAPKIDEAIDNAEGEDEIKARVALLESRVEKAKKRLS